MIKHKHDLQYKHNSSLYARQCGKLLCGKVIQTKQLLLILKVSFTSEQTSVALLCNLSKFVFGYGTSSLLPINLLSYFPQLVFQHGFTNVPCSDTQHHRIASVSFSTGRTQQTQNLQFLFQYTIVILVKTSKVCMLEITK